MKRAARTWVARLLAFQIALCGAATGATERAIDKEVTVDATLEQAWSAWTTREGIRSFFAPDAMVEPRAGGAFHIYMDPDGEPGMKGADDMRYLAMQPMKMLSFDWNAPPSLPQARAQRTFVVVRFFPVDDRHTRITLHHTGWGDGGEWDKAYVYFDRAWAVVMGNLQLRFQRGPRDWTPWLQQLEQGRKPRAPTLEREDVHSNSASSISAGRAPQR